jgi:hypothetical protein
VADLQLECRNLRKVDWLAGRGYNLVALSTAVTWTGGPEPQAGRFQFVLWENHADPIITGREEIGYAKLYAEIPDLANGGSAVAGEASWDGFTFLRFEVEDLVEAPSSKAGGSSFHVRYLPRTGEWGVAEVSQVIETPPPSRAATVVASRCGTGAISVRSGTWAQLPTLSSVVEPLSRLELGECLGAGHFITTGGRDLADSRIVADHLR